MGTPGGTSGVSHVTRIDQREDNTVEVHVQTDNFTAGQAVEVSVYLSQGETFAVYNDKKHIPIADSSNPEKPAVLQVQFPAMALKVDSELMALTRVAEVWPTTLRPEIPADLSNGLKASWTAECPSGKEPGASAAPQGNRGGTTATDQEQ